MLPAPSPPKITCLIIDDEPLARAMLAEYCAQVPFLELLGSFASAVAALAFLQSTPVDVLFLDIHMPRLTGLQLVQLLPMPAPAIIFTTAHETHAVQSYELNAVDYLLKPVAFSRFLQASCKASQARGAVPVSVPAPAPPVLPAQAMFVRHEQRLQRIEFDDILYVEGCKEYLLIYTPAGKIITLQSFRRLETVLPPGRFLRAHKSFLVAVQHIEHIERNRVQVAGRSIPIGNTYRDAFTAGLRMHCVL